MNRIKIYVLMGALLSLWACNDDFLERPPKDKLNNEIFWNSEKDLEIYMNSIYPLMFQAFGSGANMGMINGDDNTDNLAPAEFSEVAAGLHSVPNSGGGWSWSTLRKINFFLDSYDRNPDLAQASKDKYAAEARLFRAIFYYGKVLRFGNVPWVDHAPSTDDELLMATRDDRKVVMGHVMEDLDFAIANLPEKPKTQRVSKYAAMGFKARIALFEGTFRKYHNLGDHQLMLEAAAAAANQVIASGKFEIYKTGNPAVDYFNLFNMADYAGNKEMLFYQHYDAELKTHAVSRYHGSFESSSGVTKSMVDDYLCIDGKPISLSPLFLGFDTIANEIIDRDPRFTQTISSPVADDPFWDQILKPAIPGSGLGKVASTGYIYKKYFNAEQQPLGFNKQFTDAPILRYAEVLLIYAEAKAELGQADQAVIDATINEIRDRVGMAHMIIAELVKDPDSDFPELDVLIDEIRRERRVELAIEGLRRGDLMRWKAGKLLEKPVLGVHVNEADYPEISFGTNTFLNADGFLEVYKTQLPDGRVFDEDKHYYFPIPLNEISLNPNLTQNPGWE